MSYVINQFIWGYQQHFRISLQSFAERLFGNLDPTFKPDIFLIGILVEELKDSHKICLEPEDCGYKQEDFKNILELANQLETVDSETRIFHSHPIAQSIHDQRIKINSLRQAILKIIQRDSLYSNKKSYISHPAKKDGYLVFAVLQIDNVAYESHYRLNKDTVDERYSISVSLINSTINKFLEVIPQELYSPDAGANFNFSKFETDEIIKSAGKDFMYSVSSKGNNIEGLHGLFEACNIISSLKYEGEEASGGIVISPQNHHNIKMNLILDKPIKISEYRKVRKFLELSDDKNMLISDSYLIYGVGQIVGNYNPVNEDLFEIHFDKHYHWEVSHAGNCLMKVSYNQPHLPKNKINRDKFYSDLKRIYRDITKTNLDDLWLIIIEAINQKHGTMLVISAGASEETARLKNQCFAIEPIKLNESLTSKITSIDGSVLLSPDGICYAIGVILDGIATHKGDSSRGARYNSAIRYFEFTKGKYPCVIIVVSEDGMINIVPDLMPQIKKSSIIENIERLREIDNKSELNIKNFNILMEWFKDYNFYLSSDQCAEINKLRKLIDKRIEAKQKQGESFIMIIRNDLYPNLEMDESYFLPD